MTDLLTPREAGERLGVHPRRVRLWIASGELEAFNYGRTTRHPRYGIEAGALERFKASRSTKPAQPAAPTPRRRRARADAMATAERELNL